MIITLGWLQIIIICCCRCHRLWQWLWNNMMIMMDDMKNLPAAKRSMMAMTSCSLLNSSLPLWTSTRYRSIKSLILEKNGFHYNGNNDDVDYDGDGASPLSTSTRYRVDQVPGIVTIKSIDDNNARAWGPPHQGSVHVRRSQLQTTHASHETCQT